MLIFWLRFALTLSDMTRPTRARHPGSRCRRDESVSISKQPTVLFTQWRVFRASIDQAANAA